MLLPDRTVVEVGKRLCTRRHAGEGAEPDETVGIVAIAKRAEQTHAGGLLRLDEFALEQFDQFIASTRMKRVLAQFDDRAGCGVCGRARWLAMAFGGHLLAPGQVSIRACCAAIPDN